MTKWGSLRRKANLPCMLGPEAQLQLYGHAIITGMEITYTLKYEKQDIVSAQRMRFLQSSRLKIVIFLGLISIGYLVWQQLQLAQDARSWLSPVLVGIVFVVVPFLTYFLMPLLDYKVNKGWRKEYRFLISETNMDIYQPEEKRPYRFDLNRVSMIHENSDVFVLYFGSEQNFVIIPKRALQAQNKVAWFTQNMEAIHPSKWIKSGMSQ